MPYNWINEATVLPLILLRLRAQQGEPAFDGVRHQACDQLVDEITGNGAESNARDCEYLCH